MMSLPVKKIKMSMTKSPMVRTRDPKTPSPLPPTIATSLRSLNLRVRTKMNLNNRKCTETRTARKRSRLSQLISKSSRKQTITSRNE